MIRFDFNLNLQSLPMCDKAIGLLENLLLKHPSDESYRAELGRALKIKGYSWANSGAIPHFRRASELFEILVAEHPNNGDYRENFVESRVVLEFLLWNSGRVEDVEKSIDRTLAFADSPQVPPWLLGLAHTSVARIHYRQGRLEEAEVARRESVRLQKASVEQNPHAAKGTENLMSSYVGLGWQLAQRGKHAEADECYRQAYQIGQQVCADFPGMRMYQRAMHKSLGELVKSLRKQGHVDTAMDVLAKMGTRNARDLTARAELYTELGEADLASKDLQAAADFWSKSIELNPTDQELWFERGEVYRKWKRFDEAAQDYSEAIQRESDNCVFWSMRASVYLELDRIDEALVDIENAITFDPYHDFYGWEEVQQYRDKSGDSEV